MPNLKNAKKAIRQAGRRARRNKIVRAEISSLRVAFRKALETSDSSKAGEVARLVGKKLDKAVQKKVMKKNTAARIHSRIMKKLNALKKA